MYFCIRQKKFITTKQKKLSLDSIFFIQYAGLFNYIINKFNLMNKLNIIIVLTSIIVALYSIGRVVGSIEVSQNLPRQKSRQNLRMEQFAITQTMDIDIYDQKTIRDILSKISTLQEQSIQTIESQKIEIEKEAKQLNLKLQEVMEKIKECEEQAKSSQVCALQYKMSVENSQKQLQNKQKQFTQSIMQDLQNRNKSHNNNNQSQSQSRIFKLKEQYKLLLHHHINLNEKVCDQLCQQNELISLQMELKQLNNQLEYRNKEIKVLNQYVTELKEQNNKVTKDLEATELNQIKQILNENIFSMNFLQNIKAELTKFDIQFTLTHQYSTLNSIFSKLHKSAQ